MFAGFAHQWTPILTSAELGSAPRGVTLAGERLVLFRGRDGPRALADRCPHRGVQLSLGKVADGCIECPFHGWRFDGAGVRRRVPLNTLEPERLASVQATAMPTREIGGMVWVYTAPVAEAPHEPDVPEELLRGDVAVYRHAEEWNTHWTRAMENMLDTPHLPFIHRWSIGMGLRRYAVLPVQMTQTIEERPYGWRLAWGIEGQATGDGSLDWFRPNAMRLNIPIPGRMMKPMIWCVPVDAMRTRMMLVAVRDFGLYNPLYKLSDLFNLRILAEDRAVVESSDPPEVPDPAEEVHVATDKPTLRFRAWYRRHLRESVAAKAENAGSAGATGSSGATGSAGDTGSADDAGSSGA